MTTLKLDITRDLMVRKAMLRSMTLPGMVKNFLRISAFAVFGLAGPIFADDFKSKVVTPGNPIAIHVSGDEFMFIRNFTQEADASPTRGVVQVTKAGQMVDVLTAAILDPNNSPEVINTVTIAGPADVMVSCGAVTGNCFISYKKESN